MAKLISKTYADALFDLAIEQNKADDWQAEIEAIQGIIADNPQFNEIMLHPRITKEEKLGLVEEAFEGKVDPQITGLIRIVLEKDRYAQLDEIFDEFISLVKERNHVGIAWVTTAKALSESQKKAVMDKLLDTTDYTTMEMHYDVDEGVIAGMIIRIGDRVVDSTVRTKLEGLTRQLMKTQV